MFKRWVHWGIGRFEKQFGYDAAYLHEVLEVGGIAMVWAILNVQKAGEQRRDTPREAFHAARLVAAGQADCGPCLQLVVRLAERDGVAPDQLQAVLGGNREAMGDDVRLAYDFAREVLQHQDSSRSRQRIAALWGRRALVELGCCLAVGSFYPDLKRSLGYAEVCQRVELAAR